MQITLGQSLTQVMQLDLGDAGDLLATQRFEYHHLVDAVDELGTEMARHRVHHRRPLGVGIAHQLLDLRRAQVRGHDDHRIAEVHGTPLAVGQATVVQHLQEDVEDIRMRLFHLVEQDHRIGFAPYGLSQVAALLVADIAGRCADQASHGVLLHELGHVDAHHGVFGIEEEFRQRLAQLGLAHPGRAEEEEGTAGLVGIRQPGSRATHGVGHGGDRLVLADHPVVQGFFHAQQLVALAFEHLADRNAGPLGDHLGDLVFGDLVAQELVGRLLVLVDHLQTALQIGDGAVLQLGHAVEIALAAGGLQLGARLLDALLQLGGILDLGLFGFPDFLQVGVFLFEAGDVFVELFQTLARGLVLFLLQCLTFHLELDQTAIQAIQGLGLGVDLHADTAGSLVDQVDGLVRQLAVGDVAMGQLGRGNDGAVGDGHLVVYLVALLEATQDGDGVFFARLVHQHLLEAPLQGRVLLDELAVLVEGGGTHAMQLATGQRRLEHVAGIHGALGLAGADHGVQFVDEQDDAPFLLAQFIEHALEALLEFTAELGAGDQGTHVQRQQALVLEAVGYLTIDDALGQALGDGGLADAGFADQHRIVLGPALQDLDGAADLVVPADHRVELAVLGALGEIDGELVQRLAAVLGVGVVDRLAATQVVDGVLQRLARDALPQQQLAEAGVLVHGGEQHQLAGDELVTLLLGQAIGLIEQARQVLGEIHIAVGILDLGQLVQLFGEGLAQAGEVEADLAQQRENGTALLFEQGREEVQRLDGRMVVANGQGLGIRQGELQFAGETVYTHGQGPI